MTVSCDASNSNIEYVAHEAIAVDFERLESKNDLERMKPLFVRRPSTYDLQDIRQVAMKETSSIPRTENEKHAYRSIQEHSEFESWSAVASDTNQSKLNKLLWLYSSNRRRGISQIVMDQIERLSGHQQRPAVVCSFSRPRITRNGAELFKECIYQLLLHQPLLVRSHGELEYLRLRTQPLSMSLQELRKLLQGVLAALNANYPVFWIIDCFDEIEFNGNEDLEAVMKCFRSCVVESGDRLRILLVSAETPDTIDRRWRYEDDQSVETWADSGVQMICWRL